MKTIKVTNKKTGEVMTAHIKEIEDSKRFASYYRQANKNKNYKVEIVS